MTLHVLQYLRDPSSYKQAAYIACHFSVHYMPAQFVLHIHCTHMIHTLTDYIRNKRMLQHVNYPSKELDFRLYFARQLRRALDVGSLATRDEIFTASDVLLQSLVR